MDTLTTSTRSGTGRDAWQTVSHEDPARADPRRGVRVPRRLAEVVERALVDSPEIEFN